MGASPIQLLDALMPPTKETYIYRSVIISPINDQYAKMRQVLANGIFFVISRRYNAVAHFVPTKAKRVLSLSYDVALRLTRDLLLEQEGYKVTSAESFQEASARCMDSRYDLCILGHSIPARDKNELMKLFRSNCRAPVLSLQRRGEDKFPNADYYAFADAPDELMQLVATILGKSTLAGA